MFVWRCERVRSPVTIHKYLLKIMDFCITQFMLHWTSRSSRNAFHCRLCNNNWKHEMEVFENLIKLYPNEWGKIRRKKMFPFYAAFSIVCLLGLPACRLAFFFLGHVTLVIFRRNIRFDMDIKIEITIQFIKKAMLCTWIIMQRDWNTVCIFQHQCFALNLDFSRALSPHRMNYEHRNKRYM